MLTSWLSRLQTCIAVFGSNSWRIPKTERLLLWYDSSSADPATSFGCPASGNQFGVLCDPLASALLNGLYCRPHDSLLELQIPLVKDAAELFLGWSPPGPSWGAYDAPPDSLVGCRGGNPLPIPTPSTPLALRLSAPIRTRRIGSLALGASTTHTRRTPFYRATARRPNATHAIAVGILSACPSVCPSVRCVYCDKTKQRTANILIPHETAITLVFWHQQWSVGDAPFPLKSALKVTHPLRKTPTSTDFRS